MSPPTWALVAGGGTAGHTLPGIAVARALVERGHPADTVHFVGSERGSEARLVPEAGFGITLLPGRGIQRRLTLANLAAAWGLVRAVGRAVGLVRRRRPQVVLALGGYASVACALAALVWRVPLVVAEQNAVAGAANRLVARFARASAVAFTGTGLPRARLTGNPVRPEVRARVVRRDRAGARRALGVPEGATLVLAFGGSLGARRINEAVLGAAARWRDRADLAVHHVVGDRDWDRHRDQVAAIAGGVLAYRAVRYEDDMARALAAADLVVSRAGATTVAELAAIGVPSVLVPLPIASADHQTANARALVEAGAAVLVPDAELDVERLVAEVEALVEPADTLSAMAEHARALGRPDAAERVADLVEAAAGGAALGEDGERG